MNLTVCYRLRILDCYTDPLGWKDKLVDSGNPVDTSDEASCMTHLCKDVRDLDNLYSLILESGKGDLYVKTCSFIWTTCKLLFPPVLIFVWASSLQDWLDKAKFIFQLP